MRRGVGAGTCSSGVGAGEDLEIEPRTQCACLCGMCEEVLGLMERPEIIPGLPDHVALLCLLRVPRLHHGNLRAVSSTWNSVLTCLDFYRYRKALGFSDAWLFVLCTDVAASPQATCCVYDLSTRQMLCKVSLPPSCNLSQEAGLDGYRLAAVDGSVLLIGGRKSLYGSRSRTGHVHVLDTVTHRWFQGAPMRVPRSNFACGVIDGCLYIAGGYSARGKVEICTDVYDVRRDEWRKACDMPVPLDTIDCDLVFQGKLFVKGFLMESQQTVVLVYDPVADVWHRDIQMSSSGLQDGELVATDSCIFNLTLTHSFQQFSFKSGKWHNVAGPGTPVQDSFNIHAPRAFGHKNEIFVLTGEMAGPARAAAGEHADVIIHSLFLGSCWYRAGAIVQA